MVRIHVRPIASRRGFRRLTGFGRFAACWFAERFAALWSPERFTVRCFLQTLAVATVCLGDVAQLGERWLCKPEVAGSIPVVSTRKALPAITAGKVFLLGFVGLSRVALLAVRLSPSPDEMTANDTDSLGLPEFGTRGGTSAEDMRSSVLVARIVFHSVDGEAERRQRIQRPRHVEQLRIGLDVHRQVDLIVRSILL